MRGGDEGDGLTSHQNRTPALCQPCPSALPPSHTPWHAGVPAGLGFQETPHLPAVTAARDTHRFWGAQPSHAHAQTHRNTPQPPGHTLWGEGLQHIPAWSLKLI